MGRDSGRLGRVPAAGGTYLITPANLAGTQPLEFFGSDYSDSPSVMMGDPEMGGIYQSLYPAPVNPARVN